MRSLSCVCAAVFVLSMIASIEAAAEPSRIDKSMYGFYLGESKKDLLQRADEKGITYERKGKMPKQQFPDCYVFDTSMDKSKRVKFVVVSFYKDHVGELNVHLVDNSKTEYAQAAQSLEQSWNSFDGFREQIFGPVYIITVQDVLITLVTSKGETFIKYVHRAMLKAYNEENGVGTRN